MFKIRDVRELLLTENAYKVYASCMYMPTWEKYKARMELLVMDPMIQAYGYWENGTIIGLIVIRNLGDYSCEIIGIAVDAACRQQGVGQSLIQYVMESLHYTRVIAETDDEAVGFYKNCGFEVVPFVVHNHEHMYTRYKCELNIFEE